MSTENQVPSFIEDIIEQKRQVLLAERQQKAEAEKREREQAEAIGKAKHDEYIQAALLKVPEYLRQYVVFDDDPPDFYRIGKGWDTPNDWLYFEVPGLAKILFAPNAKDDPWKNQIASPYQENFDIDGYPVYTEPTLDFSERSGGWTDDLAYALGCAHAGLQKYQKYVEEYAAKKELRDQEAQLRRELEQQKEQTEEESLFDVIKNDPIAIHMLKAFVLLRDERSHFEERLYNADEALYSIENRWSRRAEELRRQADEAERRAEDDRRRLQDDLDDAEAKLKKTERGW